MIIALVLNWHDQNFQNLLWALSRLPFFILFIEALSQRLKRKNKNVKTALNLILTGIPICIAISFLSFFIISYGLIVAYDDKDMTKGMFNFLITSSFILTTAFYFTYQKCRFPEFIGRLEKRIALILSREVKNHNSIAEVEFDKELIAKQKTAKFIDSITILATVFLLSNSTFTTIIPADLDLKSNPFDSLEFSLLIFLIPIYVQSVYYRISL